MKKILIRVLIYVLSIAVIEAIVYVAFQKAVSGDKEFGFADTVRIAGQLGGEISDPGNVKGILASLTEVGPGANADPDDVKSRLSSLVSKVAGVKEQQQEEIRVLSGGVIKERKLVLVPVWVREGERIKIANGPVYFKCLKVRLGAEASVSFEIEYADGRSVSHEKIAKGKELRIKDGKKYYFLPVIDLRPDDSRGGASVIRRAPGKSVKIALYGNT